MTDNLAAKHSPEGNNRTEVNISSGTHTFTGLQDIVQVLIVCMHIATPSSHLYRVFTRPQTLLSSSKKRGQLWRNNCCTCHDLKVLTASTCMYTFAHLLMSAAIIIGSYSFDPLRLRNVTTVCSSVFKLQHNRIDETCNDNMFCC